MQVHFHSSCQIYSPIGSLQHKLQKNAAGNRLITARSLLVLISYRSYACPADSKGNNFDYRLLYRAVQIL